LIDFIQAEQGRDRATENMGIVKSIFFELFIPFFEGFCALFDERFQIVI
jgi:hypothetical protein